MSVVKFVEMTGAWGGWKGKQPERRGSETLHEMIPMTDISRLRVPVARCDREVAGSPPTSQREVMTQVGMHDVKSRKVARYCQKIESLRL